jgi:hypothetical protein
MGRRRTISLLMGFVMAVSVIPVGSALAEEGSTVEIQDQVTIAFNGTAVTVPVDVSCRPGLASLGVGVVQKRGNKSATGYGPITIECDGTVHRYDVLVEAGYVAFKKGVAFAIAEVRTCSFTGCQDFTDMEEIRIH